MDTVQQTLKKDVRLLVDQIQTLRDEIRIQIHLASMDTRDAWKKLEPDVNRVVELADQATKASVTAAEEVLRRGKKLAQTLRDDLKAGTTTKH